ncbi:shikimate dehydrogenase [Acidicapsa dinghuensis]|uniref:Shikimate dehydrogenase (NADP(+)) n=1 Tax=Acidicapsa dinghuensis TaxID=2218256 RepID=A0ABW1ELE9_9BACT|nr:shikimate dehydrogenase [Acidicapsa dinghuensis]
MPFSSSISAASYLRSRAGRICIAVQASTVREMLSRAQIALADSQFLEFRLDYLDKPAAAVKEIGKFLAEHREIVAMATCRRKQHGGKFGGTQLDELNVLAAASEAGFGILDLEIEAAEEASAFELDTLRNSDAALLISFHDFENAVDPDAVLARIQRFEPDYVKVVNTAHSLTHSVKLLQWMKRCSADVQIVGISMGEFGIISRILSLRAGSAFTYAAASEGVETAPGQINARTLKELFNIEQLDQATRIYGVAGNPVAHSLSPLMQNTAFHRERLNAVYLPLKTESIEDLLNIARQLPLSGLSITMPHKHAILPYLANVDPLTARLGACNTIRTGADGRFYGFNTDVAGIVRPLEKRMSLRNARVLVLGAGGAARAAVYGLAEKGAQVFLWSRKEAAAKELAASASAPLNGSLPIPVQVISRLEIAASEFDVLINATPCGMHGNPHPLPLEPEAWKARLVFDLVYNPLDTPLLKLARERRIATIQGVEMFVHQGARQFELWTGKPAPEADMLRVVLYALQHPHGANEHPAASKH